MQFWGSYLSFRFEVKRALCVARGYWSRRHLIRSQRRQGIAKRKDSTQIPLLSNFPCVFILWLKIKFWHTSKLSYAYPIIMNFSEDWGVGIIYLHTKFRLHRLINNGDLLADRNRWTDTHTDWIWYSPHIGLWYRVD